MEINELKLQCLNKIMSDEKIAEISNMNIQRKTNGTEEQKSRQSYKKFDFNTKMKIINDIEAGRDLYKIAAEYEVSPRRIKRITKYDLLFKETLEKNNENQYNEMRPRSKDQKARDKNILLKKGLQFFEIHSIRPSIAALADFYLNDRNFFSQNSTKVNFTRRLKRYITSKSFKETSLLNAKPLSRKKTFCLLSEIYSSASPLMKLKASESLISSRASIRQRKNSLICETEIDRMEFYSKDELGSFSLKSVDIEEEDSFFKNQDFFEGNFDFENSDGKLLDL